MAHDLLAQTSTDASVWLPLLLVLLGGGMATAIVRLVVAWWRKGIDEQDSTFTQMEHLYAAVTERCSVLEGRNEDLETRLRRNHDRKRSLEAAAYEYGMPPALIQEALK